LERCTRSDSVPRWGFGREDSIVSQKRKKLKRKGEEYRLGFAWEPTKKSSKGRSLGDNRQGAVRLRKVGIHENAVQTKGSLQPWNRALIQVKERKNTLNERRLEKREGIE